MDGCGGGEGEERRMVFRWGGRGGDELGESDSTIWVFLMNLKGRAACSWLLRASRWYHCVSHEFGAYDIST